MPRQVQVGAASGLTQLQQRGVGPGSRWVEWRREITCSSRAAGGRELHPADTLWRH